MIRRLRERHRRLVAAAALATALLVAWAFTGCADPAAEPPGRRAAEVRP